MPDEPITINAARIGPYPSGHDGRLWVQRSPDAAWESGTIITADPDVNHGPTRPVRVAVGDPARDAVVEELETMRAVAQGNKRHVARLTAAYEALEDEHDALENRVRMLLVTADGDRPADDPITVAELAAAINKPDGTSPWPKDGGFDPPLTKAERDAFLAAADELKGPGPVPQDAIGCDGGPVSHICRHNLFAQDAEPEPTLTDEEWAWQPERYGLVAGLSAEQEIRARAGDLWARASGDRWKLGDWVAWIRDGRTPDDGPGPTTGLMADVERLSRRCADRHEETERMRTESAGVRARVAAELDDTRNALRIAAESADRFRDVLSEALGYPEENPGDDVLVADLRRHFGKTGPEPTRWRDLCSSVRAVVDQINAGVANSPRNN